MNGRIVTYIHSDAVTENKAGALVKITCTSDFAARTIEFKGFCDQVAKLAVGYNITSYDELIKEAPSLKEFQNDVERVLKEPIIVKDIIILTLKDTTNESKLEQYKKTKSENLV